MRRCYKCKEEKQLTDFTKNRSKKDGYSNVCKPCNNENVLAYYRRNGKNYQSKVKDHAKAKRYDSVDKMNKLKEATGCVYCDERSAISLDYHHIDPNTKTYEISYLVACKSWSKIPEELKKCELVCTNCHRKLHKNIKLIRKDDMLSKLAKIPMTY